MSPVYFDTQQQVVDEQMNTMINNLTNRINEIVQITQEKQDIINQNACDELRTYYGLDPEPHFDTGCVDGRKNSTWGAYVSYDRETSICTVTKRVWKCTDSVAGCCWGWDKGMEASSIEDEYKLLMPKVRRDNMRSVEGSSIDQAITTKDEIINNSQSGYTQKRNAMQKALKRLQTVM